MTNRVGGEGRGITISSREMAEVAAVVREMTAMVGRLGHESRQMRQEIAQLRNAAAEPASARRLPDAVPDVRR